MISSELSVHRSEVRLCASWGLTKGSLAAHTLTAQPSLDWVKNEMA